ncbi:unnamed protein product [Anisakis simplex]|uniref:Coat protein n=1 Tax=Anisakis simplex TaxID=6269 RepID=A0A0M3KE09_ANISI|nr:unnamed protein product [Anisakis simplex]
MSMSRSEISKERVRTTKVLSRHQLRIAQGLPPSRRGDDECNTKRARKEAGSGNEVTKQMRNGALDPVVIGSEISATVTPEDFESTMKQRIRTPAVIDLVKMRNSGAVLLSNINVVVSDETVPESVRQLCVSMRAFVNSVIGVTCVENQNTAYVIDDISKMHERFSGVSPSAEVNAFFVIFEDDFTFDATRIKESYEVDLEIGDEIKRVSLRDLLSDYGNSGGQVMDVTSSDIIAPYTRFVYDKIFGEHCARFTICKTKSRKELERVPPRLTNGLLNLFLDGFAIPHDSLLQNAKQQDMRQSIIKKMAARGRQFL